MYDTLNRASDDGIVSSDHEGDATQRFVVAMAGADEWKPQSPRGRAADGATPAEM